MNMTTLIALGSRVNPVLNDTHLPVESRYVDFEGSTAPGPT